MKIRMTILSLVFLVFGCANGQQPKVESAAYNLMLKTLLSHEVKEIGVTQAHSLKDSIIFLDSRTKEEYQVSHIKDAIWVGEDFDPSKVKGIAKNKKIVVYCAVGARSEKVAKTLLDIEFEEVSNLYGGIFEWVNQGYPVFKQNAVLTDEVHAFSKVWGIWLKKGNKVYGIEKDE